MLTKKLNNFLIRGIGFVLCTAILTACGSQPSWYQLNKQVIEENELVGRTRSDIPNMKVVPSLEAGQVSSLQDFESIQLYPGVSAKMYWGHGALVSIAELEPNAEIPKEILPANRFVFVMEGDIRQMIGNEYVEMTSRKREAPDGIHAATPRADFVYLEEGDNNALKAGAQGARPRRPCESR